MHRQTEAEAEAVAEAEAEAEAKADAESQTEAEAEAEAQTEAEMETEAEAQSEAQAHAQAEAEAKAEAAVNLSDIVQRHAISVSACISTQTTLHKNAVILATFVPLLAVSTSGYRCLMFDVIIDCLTAELFM